MINIIIPIITIFMNDLFNGLISLSQVAQLRWLSESCVEILDGGSLSVRQSYYIMLLS